MEQLKEIKISSIKANQFQPRTIFDDQAIQQLAQSIKENGLIQPIAVKETYLGYELIAGERRLRACKLLGYDTINAVVLPSSEVASATMALLENIQRENLSATEEANGYLQIIRLTGLTQQQLAEKVGKSQSTIANKLRLLNLDSEVIEAIDNKTITERHGRALLSLNPEQQKKALKSIVDKDMNVKQTEMYVESHFTNPKKKSTIRCFGVATRLIINSFKETYNKIKQLPCEVSYDEKETEDSVILTFTIKK